MILMLNPVRGFWMTTKKKKSLTGFTLMELLIVIAIVAVLVTLAINYYGPYRERTLDREAQAALRLIVAAERIYRMEIGGYYAATNNQAINDNFKLLLPSGANRYWDYSTTGGASTTCAQATRTPAAGGKSRTWRMRLDEENPVEGATCP